MGPTVMPRTGVFRSHGAASAPVACAMSVTAVAARSASLRMRFVVPATECVDERVADVGDARDRGIRAGPEQARFGMGMGDADANQARALGRCDAGQRVFDDEHSARGGLAEP